MLDNSEFKESLEQGNKLEKKIIGEKEIITGIILVENTIKCTKNQFQKTLSKFNEKETQEVEAEEQEIYDGLSKERKVFKESNNNLSNDYNEILKGYGTTVEAVNKSIEQFKQSQNNININQEELDEYIKNGGTEVLLEPTDIIAGGIFGIWKVPLEIPDNGKYLMEAKNGNKEWTQHVEKALKTKLIPEGFDKLNSKQFGELLHKTIIDNWINIEGRILHMTQSQREMFFTQHSQAIENIVKRVQNNPQEAIKFKNDIKKYVFDVKIEARRYIALGRIEIKIKEIIIELNKILTFF